MLFISCRDAKQIGATDLITQMDNWVLVQKRGYPFKFNNAGEFNQFKTELKSGLSDLNMHTNDVKLQGSAVRSSTPDDLDLAVTLSKSEMDDAIKSAYSSKITKKVNGIENKVDMSNYSESQLKALQQEIDADVSRTIFNSQGRNFSDNFKTRRLWPDSYPGLKTMRDNLINKYGKLNITIQESTSVKSLKPYLDL